MNETFSASSFKFEDDEPQGKSFSADSFKFDDDAEKPSNSEYEQVETDAEHTPAFYPGDEDEHVKRVKAHKGATIGHYNRPFRVNRDDKTGKVTGYSTTESSVVPELDGTFSVIPTIWKDKRDGAPLTAIDENDAAAHYRETESGKDAGERFGNFATEEEAKAAAKDIHELHQKAYAQKWHQFIHEHWDEMSDEIKADPGTAKEHEEWEKAGRPKFKWERKKQTEQGGEPEWPDKDTPKEKGEVFENLRQSLKAETGKDYGKGLSAAIYAAPGGAKAAKMTANQTMKDAERLMNGDYKDEDAERLFDNLFGGGAFKEAKAQSVNGLESQQQLRNFMSDRAKEWIAENVRSRREAEADLTARPLSGWGKAAGMTIQGLGYVQEYALPGGQIGNVARGIGIGAKIVNGLAHGAVPFVAAASERYSDFTTNGYGIDDDGGVYVAEKADTTGRAAFKAARGAAGEVAVEMLGGEALGAGVKLVGKGALKTLGYAGKKVVGGLNRTGAGRVVVDAVGKYGAKVVDNRLSQEAGRFAMDFIRAGEELNAWSAISSPPGEVFEEDVQALLDNTFGWAKKDSEYRGIVNEWKNDKTFTWDGQVDILYGLAGQMLFSTAVGVYGGYKARKEANKDRPKVEAMLERMGVSERNMRALTTDKMKLLQAQIDRWQDNPDELRKFAENAGFFMKRAVNDLMGREYANFTQSLEQRGVEPAKFKFQSVKDENGNDVPSFTDKARVDRVVGDMKAKMMSDAENGVSIIDNQDGTYTVLNDKRGQEWTVDSFEDAHNVADYEAVRNQSNDLDNKEKNLYIQNELARNYKGRKVETVYTIKQLHNFIKSAVENGGKWHGIENPDSVFGKVGKDGRLKVMKSGGFRTPDGTIVLILDNIRNPYQANRLLAHESSHGGTAGGGRYNAGDIDFLQQLESAPEYAQHRDEVWNNIYNSVLSRGGDEKAARAAADEVLDSDEGWKESFAELMQMRTHNPTKEQIAEYRENEARRRNGEDVPFTDADFECIAAEMERGANRGKGGFNPLSGGNYVEFIDMEDKDATSDEEYLGGKPAEKPVVTADLSNAPDETHENAPVSVPGEKGTTSQPEAEKPTEGEGGASGGAREEYVSGLNKYSTENDKRFVDVATEDEFAKANELRKKFTDDPSDEALKEFSDYVDGVIAKADEASAKANETAGVKPTPTVRSVEDYVTAKPDMSDAEKSALTEAVKKVGDETDEMQIAGDKGILGSLLKRGPLMLLDPQKVDTSDEELPNFKLGVDRKTGIRTPLEGKWMPSLAGFGVVWLRSDGKLVQATGRHRNQKAREANEPMWNVVLRESDGWTKEKMALIDGTFNIKDGKGDVADYVRFFEDSGFDRKDAEENGLLSDKGLVAWSIYADATDATRAATDLTGSGEEGKITPEQASIIAQAAPKGENPRNGLIQSVLLRKAQAGKRGEAFRGYARMMANDLRSSKANANLTEGQQMDLFMNDPEVLAIDALNEKRSAYMMKKSGEFADQANLLRTAITKGTKLELRPEAAKALGIEDANDKEQLKAAYDKALHLSDYWNPAKDHVLDEADKSAMDAEINAKADANAKRREELKAKLAAVKSGKPLPKKAVSKKETTANTEKSSAVEKTKFDGEYGKLVDEYKAAEKRLDDSIANEKNGNIDEVARLEALNERRAAELKLRKFEKDNRSTETFDRTPDMSLSSNEISNRIRETRNEIAIAKAEREKNAKKQSAPHKRTVVMKNADEEKKADAALADIDFDTDLAFDFGNAERYGKWLGKYKLPHSKARQKEWSGRNEVQFSTEFDYEKFGKLVAGVGKLVDVLTESGHKDFKALATFISERDAAKYQRAKAVLQDVWNAVARQKGLERVSDAQADEVFGIIESSTKGGGDEKRVGSDKGTGGDGNNIDRPDEGASTGDGGSSGGSLAGGRVRKANPDERVDGGRPGGVPGREKGLADKDVQNGEAAGGGKAAGGNEPVADRAGHGAGESASQGNRAESEVATEAADATKVTPPKHPDFTMTKAVESAILERDPIKRAKNNLAAIRLLRKLRSEDRTATPDEQETLAKYVGWGGLSQILDYSYDRAYSSEQSDGKPDEYYIRKAKYGAEGYELYKEMRSMLNDEEMSAIRESTLSAFYTPVEMVRAEHDALRAIGVLGGRFLGPSAGTGNYASAAGDYAKGVRWQFVELDKTTGEILKHLFPNQRVEVSGYEKTNLPDSYYDIAIDNVPYVDFNVTTDKAIPSMKLHDYFFAKTLSKLRPGGVMMFLTSTGTLDKASPTLRKYLSENGGQIVGAVRLPNGFFSKNAGTDAASDLVIVQKKDGVVDNSAFEGGQKFGEATEYVRRQGRVQVDLTYNKYFADNPGQVIGEMKAGSGQYGRPVLEYKMPKGDLFKQVREAIDRALSGVDKNALLKEATVAEVKERTPIYDDMGLRQGSVAEKDGKFMVKAGEELIPVALPSDRLTPDGEPNKGYQAINRELMKRFIDPKKMMRGLFAVRKAMRDVVDAEMRGCTDEELAPLLEALNTEYDGFVKRFGALNSKYIVPFVMLDTADGNRMMALERTVKDKVVKSDIFSKRVIFKSQRPTKAETPMEAMIIGYSEAGFLNPTRVAELLGCTYDEAVKKLKDTGSVFENPQTGKLEPSWQYLSGRVRTKLAAARAAADQDAAYAPNVKALESVIPSDVNIHEVKIPFNASWTTPEVMADFIRDAFGAENLNVNFTLNKDTGLWFADYGRSRLDVAENPWGETSWRVDEFILRVLNNETMEHWNSYKIGDETVREFDREGTEKNKLAKERLNRAFESFVQNSEKWHDEMERRYNDTMNDQVPMTLPPGILPFEAAGMRNDSILKLFEKGEDGKPDMKRPKKGREYQSNVIAIGVLGGQNLYLAHCVGAGKTMEMQSISMLGRHLGQFKKPIHVVPNHMLEQYCNEWLADFPDANILKMTDEDVKPENRRRFFAMAANGDWDAIVVKRDTFAKKLSMSEEYQREYYDRLLDEYELAVMAATEANGKGDSIVKELEKRFKKLREKVEKKMKALAEKKDKQIVKFEELGVDQIFVDEAHNFKGLPVATNQGRVKGLSQGDSSRAEDMEMKCDYIQSVRGGEVGVVFASGTSLSNAPVIEAYVVLRYLAKRKLEEQGLEHFDQFVSQFGTIETIDKVSMGGNDTKESQEVTGIQNAPEMMRLFRSVVNIVNSEQLDLPRPTKKLIPVKVGLTPMQRTVMHMVARECMISGGKEDKGKMMKLANIAKSVCISPRLLGIDEDGEKLGELARRVKEIYDDTSKDSGTQLVFTDKFNISEEATIAGMRSYMNSQELNDIKWHGKKNFDFNHAIVDALVAQGIPREEIAVMQDLDKMKGDKDQNKGELFKKVKSGKVRVLIGSRPRMGEGTNVQDRLAAIHLMHPGWKPAEDEQAQGRIIRWGNMYKDGKVFYYLTQGDESVVDDRYKEKIGSYETSNFELIGKKSVLINNIMRGDESQRNVSLNSEEDEADLLMGMTIGNPAQAELIKMRKPLHKLELDVSDLMTQARRKRDQANYNEEKLKKEEADFDSEKDRIEKWIEKQGDKPFSVETPDGPFDKMNKLADYINGKISEQLAKDKYDREDFTVGTLNGSSLEVQFPYGENFVKIGFPELGQWKEVTFDGFVSNLTMQGLSVFYSRDVKGYATPEYIERKKAQFASYRSQIAKMRETADAFEKEYKEKGKLLASEKRRQLELQRQVYPLVVKTTDTHGFSAYGNWVIRKRSDGFVAQRMGTDKTVKAKTVREIIPLIDAEDLGDPSAAAKETADLAKFLERNRITDEGEVKNVPADEVDFDTYLFDVFGPSGKETIEVNNAKSLKQARSRAIFRYFTGGERRDLTPQERGAYNDVDTYIKSFNNIPVKTVIIRAGEHADKYEAGLKKYITDHPEAVDRARRLAVSRKEAVGGVGGTGDSGRRGSGAGGGILPSQSRPVGGLTQGTFSDLGVDFDTNLTPEEAAYAESEDKAPTEKVMREVFGMTNEDIETAMRAAKMEPPRHETKSDARTWEQAEVLLSRPEYMAKLSRAVYKVGRPVTDYENFALNEFFRERQEKVNELTELLNDMMAMPEEALADPETAQMLKDTKRDLAEARQLMYETGVAARQAASEQGRALRSNRGLLDKHDLTFAGILGQISSDAGGIARVTAEMDARIKEISEEFGKLDEEGKEIATARLKAFSEKIVNDIKNGGRVRRASEKMVGDEAKRVNRNYLDALAQIEVHAAEAGDTLIGLVDQMYPSWGRWLKYLGEYHCFVNPEISEDDCIKAIVEDIQPFLPGIDENQVRDMLTGFGHNYRQSRYDSQRLMNDLRSQARMKRQLDYMNENNQLPPATGMVRDEPSQTARQLAKEVQERKKEVDETNGGANRLKGALAAAKTRVKNRIEDLQRAIDSGEKIPGRERTVREDEELRQLKAHKDSLQAIYDNMFKTTNGVTDEQRVRMVEKALAKELERTMADYARAMSGDFSGRAKRPSVTSETAEELRGKIRETRNLILELKKANYEFGLTPDEIAKRNARKVAAREAAIIRMAERIERGDIRPMKKPQPPMPADLQARYDEMGRQLKRAHQKLADMRLDAQNATVPAWRRRGAEFVKFLTASQRALMATMDFSAVLRQAARISLGHPKIAYKSFGKSVRAMANDVRLSEINDEIMSDASVREAVEKYGLHMRDVDAANGRDVEMFHGMERNRIRMFGKEMAITDIPLFGELMLKSERHYITYLNSVSAELYTALANDKTRFPDGPTPWQKKAICDMINMWNGSGAISKERRSAMLKSGINEVFWAPGLAISRIQTAAGYDIWAPLVSKGIANEQGGYDAPSAEERKTMAKLGLAEHVKSSLAMIALGALLKFITADDDDWYQFGQADWFEKLMMLASPKVGNTTIDLTGGERSVYDLAHTLVTGRKRTSTGRTQKLGEGYKAPDAVSVVQRFMEGKWSPWLSEAFALYNGKDYTGQQYGLMQFLANKVPLSASDIKDQVTMNGIGTSLLTAPLTLLGAGGSTYDRKPYENAVNPFLEAKKEYDAVDADESIEDGEREAKLSQMREDNPLLRDEVREDIAADLAAIRKDENRAKRMKKNGEEPDAELNDQIEQGKREVLEKIRKYRR